MPWSEGGKRVCGNLYMLSRGISFLGNFDPFPHMSPESRRQMDDAVYQSPMPALFPDLIQRDRMNDLM